MEYTGTATAPVANKPFTKIEDNARADALGMSNKGELITALLRVPNLHVYRHHESGEIAFAVGDAAPAWGNDPT